MCLDEANNNLISDIKRLIDKSRDEVSKSLNREMSLLYWEIGNRINNEVLGDRRAEYGKQVIQNLTESLQQDYGSSFSEKNLRRMMQFARTFPDKGIVVSVIRQLSWTHLLAVIPIEEPLKRDFYIQMCIHEGWSVRTFRERIKSMLFERTAISRKPEETVSNELDLLKNEQKMTADMVFRDPYVLDFLNLKDAYSENDLESAIIAQLQRFIIELGSDFAFLARQKRITIDNRDYYIDLLFYHRRLKSLIAIDLKIGEFDAAYKGEMELYLGYLEKYEFIDGENPPIGLILCAGKNPEHIELMQLHMSNIRVADYLTALPPMDVLRDRLKRSVIMARESLLDSRNTDKEPE